MQIESMAPDAILGMASGVYRESPVLSALNAHFSSVWLHHKQAEHPAITAVVPDTCADLIWFHGKLLVAGPDRRVSFEHVPPGVSVVGLRFRPGAVGNWLRIPASEIVGSRVPLDCFWPRRFEELMEVVGDAADPHVVAQRLQTGLGRIAPGIDLPHRSTRVILSVVRHLKKAKKPITRALTEALGTSERTLRRHCEKDFGFGAKTLDRILRMQKFLDLGITFPSADLTSLAAAAGYADQAHLTREARRLAGLTPKVILAQISEYSASRNHGRFVQDDHARSPS
jgi:AraC-like DNA-binding protein